MDDDGAASDDARAVTPPNFIPDRHRTEPDEAGESVASLLRNLWSNDETIVEEAMHKLWHIHLYDKDWYSVKRTQNQEEFSQLGGHAVVVGVMKKHPDSEAIQLDGICVLHNASYKNSSLRSMIGNVGGVEAVLAAMRNFVPPDANLIRNGLCALVNLTYDQKQNSEFLVLHSGDMKFLLEQVEHFSSDTNIVSSFCQLLKKLCVFYDLRRALVVAGAKSTLTLVSDIHQEDPRIQSTAEWVNWQLVEL